MSELPDADPPFFFRRVWSGHTDMDEVTLFTHQPDGTLLITVGVPKADVPEEISANAAYMPDLASDGLVIYGRAVAPSDPNDEHDKQHIAEMKKRGQVFSECFSVVETEGELGTHPLAAVTEISREEFEAARARGWT